MLARMGGLPSPLMSGSSKLPAAAFAAGRSQTRSTEAYEAYLRGRQLVAERAAATGPAAIKEFERAIALDPAFAAAHAGLVDAYVIAAEYSGYDLKTATAAAERHAAIALDLAPASAEALTANAVLKIDAGENEAGLAFADRALLANQNLADAHHRRALALIGLGRAAEAYEELKIVKALDPLNPNALSNITVMSLEFGDFETAKAAAADNIKWNPRSAIAHKSESELLARLGDYAGAHRSLKTAEALNPTDKSLADYFAQLYWEIDMKAEARTYANRWLSKAILSTGDRTTALALAAANANDPYAGVIANLAGDSRQAAAYCRTGSSSRFPVTTL
jgi:Flp pilus assembly protein TadD